MHCDVEAKCLAELNGIASRGAEQKSMILKLDNGYIKLVHQHGRLRNRRRELRTYNPLVGYLPLQNLFVLSGGRYGGFNSLIINSRPNGELFRITGWGAAFSPNGKRFVVAVLNEQDGLNQVAIYSTNAFPRSEWSHTPNSFAAGFEVRCLEWERQDRTANG